MAEPGTTEAGTKTRLLVDVRNTPYLPDRPFRPSATEFILENQQELERIFEDSEEDKKRQSLAKFFYGNFYSNPYEFIPPGVKQEDLKKSHEHYTRELKRSMIDLLPHNEAVLFETEDGNFYVWETHGGFDRNKPYGRLYIHANPNGALLFFDDFGLNMHKDGISAQMKTDIRDPINMYRPDLLVLYFNSDQERKVYDVVTRLRYNFDERQDTTYKEIPPFSAQVLDPRENPIRGLAFAQQPPNSASFGELHSGILADIYISLFSGGRIPTPEEIVAEHRHLLEEAGMDPLQPALNLAERSEGNFPVFKSHIRQFDKKALIP